MVDSLLPYRVSEYWLMELYEVAPARQRGHDVTWGQPYIIK